MSYTFRAPAWTAGAFGLLWLAAVAWLSALPTVPGPQSRFRMPGSLWLKAAAMLANLHLICEPVLSPILSNLFPGRLRVMNLHAHQHRCIWPC